MEAIVGLLAVFFIFSGPAALAIAITGRKQLTTRVDVMEIDLTSVRDRLRWTPRPPRVWE